MVSAEFRTFPTRRVDINVLQAFEIGAMEDLGASRKFQVKLTLEGAKAPVDVTSIIVGKDPLWVFRDKDYPGAAM